MDGSSKFFELVHPGGPKGILQGEPKMREQDKSARDGEGYVVCFFPRITGIGAANLNYPGALETFSQTPEAAVMKFMDRIKRGEKWETYRDAGHRVRKVKIVDLGDAE